MGKTFYYQWRWKMNASPEVVWPLASDTHNFNHVTGLPKLKFEEKADSNGTVRRFASGKLFGLVPIAWEEFTFEWVKPLRFGVQRLYRPPFPMKSLKALTHLHPTPNGGTEIEYEVWAEARGILGLVAVPFGVGLRSQKLFGQAFDQMNQFLQGISQHPFRLPPVEISPAGQSRLDSLFAELRRAAYPVDLLEAFQHHLRTSPVEGVTRMRPYALADQWQFKRDHVLNLFLHAASLGLLDLSWDILCPECRGAKFKTESLINLPETVHCPSCNIDYSAEFDQSVEATFSLNQQITDISRDEYCIGGPHATPHILMQQLLQPNETRTTPMPLKAGLYRLRAPRLGGGDSVRIPASILTPMAGQPFLTAAPSSSSTELLVQINPHNLSLSQSQVTVSTVHFTLTNCTSREQVLILEDGTWSSQIASAADVTALQVFRELFSREALRPGYTVSIQSLVFLFTDLKGSTTLYQQIGDATAFSRVIDHFDILREVISQHRGAVVKTIGDAVMAVFRDPAHAVEACLTMQTQIAAYNQQHQDAPLTLKLGLHQGTCIAVNLNERLDYFGSTVNIAARLENKSIGGDIVTTHTLMDDVGVQEVLLNYPVEIERFAAELKGFGEHKLYRIRHSV